MQSYKRILLKLSGESLMGDRSFGLDPAMISYYAKEIKTISIQGEEQIEDVSSKAK